MYDQTVESTCSHDACMTERGEFMVRSTKKHSLFYTPIVFCVWIQISIQHSLSQSQFEKRALPGTCGSIAESVSFLAQSTLVDLLGVNMKQVGNSIPRLAEA